MPSNPQVFQMFNSQLYPMHLRCIESTHDGGGSVRDGVTMTLYECVTPWVASWDSFKETRHIMLFRINDQRFCSFNKQPRFNLNKGIFEIFVKLETLDGDNDDVYDSHYNSNGSNDGEKLNLDGWTKLASKEITEAQAHRRGSIVVTRNSSHPSTKRISRSRTNGNKE